MGKIEIVSASAGSGKTYTITELVLERLRSKQLGPEALLATTFTNKAAAELQQRIRARLFQAGLIEEAQRIEGARIGTVNAVCGRLLQEFAFELGMSPAQRVLDEESAKATLRRAVSRVVTPAELDRLSTCQRSFGNNRDRTWLDDVSDIINAARSNRIAAAELPGFAQRSVDGLLVHLSAPAASGQALDEALMEALDCFVQAAAALKKPTKGTAAAAKNARAMLGQLHRGALPWPAWLKLAGLVTPKDGEEAAAPVRVAASAYAKHPRLREELHDFTHLVFQLAARALTAYADEKAEWGVVDFVDQEARALELLERPDVAERLSSELELVVVDEFQDTSPLQLALFARLSQLAKESVWVGDPKQAIFSFRGTDPALMEAALEALKGQATVKTLDTSYRSRAPLVEVTSKLFTAPFAAQGLPANRVVLKPKSARDDPKLGPFIESWTLDTPNSAETAIALAHCVEQLLADTSVRVRDAATDALRTLLPGDLAVLCRANSRCHDVAAALEQRGVRAAVAREGLLSTPEVRLALAAFRLFIDPRDNLASAELARLESHADDPDGWLDAALAPRGKSVVAFADEPFHQAMNEARLAFPAAGPLAALDAALEAAQVRETCLRWGASAARHANLDAFRAHAHAYVRTCEAGGAAATPAGLLVWLNDLGSDGADERAVVTGEDAVNVLTWHGAKGLEWPVVVLDQLDKKDRPRIWGPTVQSDAAAFDFNAPLAGRWIRFWQHPFGQMSSSDFHEGINTGPEALYAQNQAAREGLRLLYVGWTRPRDRLVLALKAGDYDVRELERFAVNGAAPVSAPDEQGQCAWAGWPFTVKERTGLPEAPEAVTASPDAAPLPAGKATFPPAWRSPSKEEQQGTAGAPVTVGPRRVPSGPVDMDQLGMALHAFYAADVDGLTGAQRQALADQCLKNRQVAGALTADDVVATGDALKQWADGFAKGAKWLRELPVSHPQPDGSVVRGTADLVLETKDALILVDHKSYPGAVEEAVQRAAGYAGQLAAYARALEAAMGKPVTSFQVHLPLAGVVVAVE